MRPIFVIISATAAATVLLVMMAPFVAPAGQRCTACHTAPNASGGYEFRMPALDVVCPSSVPPNTSFNVSLTLRHQGSYEVREPQATLNLTGNGLPGPRANDSRALSPISSQGGASSIAWTVESGNSSGTVRLGITVGFTAHFRHTTPGSEDNARFAFSRFSMIDIRPSVVYCTVGSMSLSDITGRTASFELVCVSSAANITISASPNLAKALALSQASITGMEPGQRSTVTLTVANGSIPVDNGRIDILWENATGAIDSSFVLVTVQRAVGAATAASMSPLILTGRVTGMASLGLLLASMVLGYVKKGGERRVRVHCAVSWFILGLSVYHGIMLAWGPYSRVWLGNWMVLGFVSVAVMGISSINGLVQKWMVARTGYRAWAWIHRGTIIAGIVLVSIHAILMGTDFAAVRNLFLPAALPHSYL